MTTPFTPNLNSLGGAFARMIARGEAAAGKLITKMDGVGAGAEDSVAKFGGAVDHVAAVVKNIDDAANQMMGGNGGPPLGNSDASSTTQNSGASGATGATGATGGATGSTGATGQA
jgi:hypothetical protein